jgi:hypothetical protein
VGYLRAVPHEQIVKYGSPIWEDLFLVRMRYKDTKSVDELRQFGMPTVFNQQRDQQIHNEVITIMLTIDAIVEHFRVGTRVEFVRNGDVEVIYDIVNNYLKAWDIQMHHGINTGTAPVEDLLLLDRFADALYLQSRIFNGPRSKHGLEMVNNLIGGSTFNRLSLLAGAQPDTAKQEVDKHQSMAATFSNKVIELGPKIDTNKPAGVGRWK